MNEAASLILSEAVGGRPATSSQTAARGAAAALLGKPGGDKQPRDTAEARPGGEKQSRDTAEARPGGEKQSRDTAEARPGGEKQSRDTAEARRSAKR
jgi:hypothetical protein